MVAVPMFKEDEPIGVISIYRREVRPFGDKQIELVSNFAKQAVIAIENTRLLSELRQRTDDLGESLQQQTATADVLKVISSSPGELEAGVQWQCLSNAVRICDAGLWWFCGFTMGTLSGLAHSTTCQMSSQSLWISSGTASALRQKAIAGSHAS